jgi:F-type H+-transporting ATPase subunit a
MASDPLAEVIDQTSIPLEIGGIHIDLPVLVAPSEPLLPEGFPTKFHLLLTLAFFLVLILFWSAGKVVNTRGQKRSRFAAFVEMILLFVRDNIAKPGIGEHDYKKFLPFLWTLFLFILIANLLGMIPFFGTPTASLMVTGGLAIISFLVIHINGMIANHGPFGYLKTFKPHIDKDTGLMKIIGPPIEIMIFFLELLGALIRGVVLAIRLFANMLAGHTALFVVLSFIKLIGVAAETDPLCNVLYWPVTGMSVALVTALSVLELFVACLQAFVFTFLTATFIGLAMHPEH